jgi:uncharacterized protein YqgV (UPF0045/DUF77 family)
MRTTAEISMYPLADDYIGPIREIIKKLNTYHGLEVSTYPTATVLVGEHDVVMDALKDALGWSHERFGTSVFVTKLITGYEAQ